MSQSNGETAPVGMENINTDIVTLTRFLNEEQTKHPEATGEFTHVYFLAPSCLDLTHTYVVGSFAMLFNSPSSL